ncbi:hypothetical protein [Streptomyces avidinii]|uniref:SUKH-3 immunity protein of toxin-antitoxin system n=1 Tax=Streptomyces avidinii TaxID=1895 RepID=A0ABS4L9B6_STRAV|nr:hypothetical protein [Streptomyces avidinii]MBP2038640.1 hypothetical protein [Streptomyces avidinii]GGZ12490.1 hypothetical protein GCM10010343_44530 [Streptomyces avidinii]
MQDGDLKVSKVSWEAAVRHLYEDAFTFSATGPRGHEDWRADVLAVMERAVPDPRGWAGLDDTANERTAEGPAFPFRPPFKADPQRRLTPADVGQRLYEIDRASAENLLLALTDGGCTLRNLERFTESFEELQDMARTLLARYGDTFTCYTNVSVGTRRNGTLDFESSQWGYIPMTFYWEDAGLVVVSDTEVGLFWTFDC